MKTGEDLLRFLREYNQLRHKVLKLGSRAMTQFCSKMSTSEAKKALSFRIRPGIKFTIILSTFESMVWINEREYENFVLVALYRSFYFENCMYTYSNCLSTNVFVEKIAQNACKLSTQQLGFQAYTGLVDSGDSKVFRLYEVNSKFDINHHYGCESLCFLVSLDETTSQL